MEPAHKNPDIRIWHEKSSQKSGFAKVERICKHYMLYFLTKLKKVMPFQVRHQFVSRKKFSIK